MKYVEIIEHDFTKFEITCWFVFGSVFGTILGKIIY